MRLIFAYPDNEQQAILFAKAAGYEMGEVKIRHFPDGESLMQLETYVKDRDVVFFCSLDNPDC